MKEICLSCGYDNKKEVTTYCSMCGFEEPVDLGSEAIIEEARKVKDLTGISQVVFQINRSESYGYMPRHVFDEIVDMCPFKLMLIVF